MTWQLLTIRIQISSQINTIEQIIVFNFENDYSYSHMITTFCDAFSDALIYLILTIKIASTERPLSKLKLIKNDLKNSMFHDRLSNIGISNIKN